LITTEGKELGSDALINNIVKIQEFDKPELKKYVEGNIGYLTNRFTALSERMVTLTLHSLKR